MEAANRPLKKVLVVCTGNTCRSPMAEGWLNHKLADKGWIAESAGVAAWGGGCASPEAIEVMREIGIDIAPEHAIQWLTANPAKAMGILDQTGTLTWITALGTRRPTQHQRR